MRKILLLAAVAALAGCQKEKAAAPADEANMAMPADENMGNAADAAMADAKLASLNETSWEFTDAKTKKPMQESIDAAGQYIVASGKEHIDHGTGVMKDGKACFTSAMTKDGEVCWTDPMLAVGASGETVSDKGEKLPIKRVAYVAQSM